jgi:hypothetical protein
MKNRLFSKFLSVDVWPTDFRKPTNLFLENQQISRMVRTVNEDHEKRARLCCAP